MDTIVISKYEGGRRKAVLNRKKHSVDFADAVSVLGNERAVTILDDIVEEERFITLGRRCPRTSLLGHLYLAWRSGA